MNTDKLLPCNIPMRSKFDELQESSASCVKHVTGKLQVSLFQAKDQKDWNLSEGNCHKCSRLLTGKSDEKSAFTTGLLLFITGLSECMIYCNIITFIFMSYLFTINLFKTHTF